MSAVASCSGSPSRPTTEPPKRCARLRARSAWRLATKIVPAPRSASACAVSSLVSPAPRITTWRSRRSPEQLDGEPDRGGGDAHVAGTDAGLRAHPLAGRQRGAPQAVGERPGAAGLQRRLEGALDLPLDLGLADDHRFQAGGHPVEVARGVAVARRVDLLRQLGEADRGVVGEHPQRVLLRLN